MLDVGAIAELGKYMQYKGKASFLFVFESCNQQISQLDGKPDVCCMQNAGC